MTPSLRRAVCAAWCVVAAAVLAPGAARAQIPSDAAWRVIDTPHFRVHFTQGMEPLARRAGARAEEAFAAVSGVLVHPPAGRVDVVIADNVDFSNGFATPFPRNRVVLYAHPPVDDPTLDYYDDWMQLVITHELTHIFHLDYARGLPRIPRYVFGRLPLGFPGTTTTTWTKEGLATYLESRLTGAGRVRGTIHEMQLRAAVLEGRFFSIDRASGDPTSWPGGSTAYVYGSMFLEYLSEHHGEAAAGEFVRRYGGYVVPFLNDHAARGAYGVTFTRAWREWQASLETRYRAEADALRAAGLTEPEVLTPAGRRADFPRWSPDGRWIAYAAQTGQEEAQQRLVDAVDGEEHVIAPRITLAPESWAADGRSMVTAMIDLRDPFHAYSDLYRIGVDGGRERMTEGARLLQPDLARDGRVVAVRAGGGTTVPVVIDAPGAAPRALAAPSLDVQWAYPRWSPDGSKLAISRWRQGGYYDVVILDSSGHLLAQATNDRAVDTAPAWSPDGRWVLFSSDRTGIANLFAYEVDGGRVMQVTSVLTGAFQPDVSPDGRWIAFQLYRSDGYHIARIPFAPDTWRPAPPVRAEVAPAADQPDPNRGASGDAHAYSALRTVLPAYWEPTWVSSGAFGTGVGVSTGGNDVVERHSWGASGVVYPSDGRVEGGVAYIFRGLRNPALGASVFQDWSVPLRAAVTTPGGAQVIDLLERERSASVVATFTRPRYRSYSWLSLAANLRDRDLQWSDAEFAPATPLDRPPELGAMATLGLSTARAYDFSISTQDGFVAAASVEGRRATRPRDGETAHRGYTRVDGRAQAYHGFRGWGFARHVLALRAVGGADFGSATQYFAVGGTTGDGVAFPLSTGAALGGTRDLFVRGYDEATQFGDRAVAGSAEWRFPVALVERGVGLVPVFLDRVWGTAFVDGATAWCVQGCDPATAAAFTRADPLVSVGAELGGDVLLGFNARFRLRGGVALPLTAVPTLAGPRERPPVKAYFVLGQSF